MAWMMAKDRIIEFLAEAAFKQSVGTNHIALRPRVGKTSIGKSIAAALGRKFYRLSLGGMRDEAEIKGASPHLHWCHARKICPGVERSGHSQPGHYARRNRQAGSFLPGETLEAHY